ncbi:hypothetical protein [Streptomyces sp. NPDC058674]|uniref:hypothetical protein n=1 Tax=Streptomyces sp. NPDC058674 TaxID=3346592 RepID=UPI003666ED83
MRIYATADQYEEYTGGAAPDDIEYRLARASEFLDAQVFRYCSYATDTAGLPTESAVAAALARATCAQAQWGVDVGDITGASSAGWGSVKIGSVQLSRSVTAVNGADSPGRQVAPAVWDALQSSELLAVGFRMGAVGLWA